MRSELRNTLLLVAGLLVVGLAGCSGDDSPTDPGDTGPDPEAELTERIRSELDLWPLPETVPYPPDNQPADAGYAERVELGRLLFFDPLLSGPEDISCGHCHHPAFAWGDGRGLSIGVGGEGLGPDRQRGLPRGEVSLETWEFFTPRNSPTMLDVGRNLPFENGEGPWDGRMFWDGRTSGLEAQARSPVRSRDEMRHDAYTTHDAVGEVIDKLRGVPEYVQLFMDAFPGVLDELGVPEGFEEFAINGNTYSRAIAAYERELFTGDSPYDRFARGDDDALTPSQKRGLWLFHEVGCVDCHSGPTFSDFEFRALGVKQGGPGKPPIHERGDGSDIGRFAANPEAQLDPANRWAFRTPSLRNVALTAPYFHTGGVGTPGDADYQTLRQVVEFFDRGGNDEGLPPDAVHPFVRPLGLEESQIDDLVAFLESLTSTRILSPYVDPTVPAEVPSGLAPPPALPPVIGN